MSKNSPNSRMMLSPGNREMIRYKQLQQRYSIQENTLKYMELDYEDLRNAHDDLQKNNIILREQLVKSRGLEEKIKELENDIDSLQRELSSLKNELDQLNLKMRQCERQKLMAESENNSLFEQNAFLTDQIDSLKEKNEKYMIQLKEYQESIKALERQLFRYQRDLEEERRKHSECKFALEVAQRDIEDVRQMKIEMDQNMTAGVKGFLSLKDEIDEINNAHLESDRLIEQYESANQELKQVKQELKDVKMENETLNRQLVSLKEQSQHYKKQYEIARKEIEEKEATKAREVKRLKMMQQLQNESSNSWVNKSNADDDDQVQPIHRSIPELNNQKFTQPSSDQKPRTTSAHMPLRLKSAEFMATPAKASCPKLIMPRSRSRTTSVQPHIGRYPSSYLSLAPTSENTDSKCDSVRNRNLQTPVHMRSSFNPVTGDFDENVKGTPLSKNSFTVIKPLRDVN